MAVYVDDAIWSWVGKRWCHLLADDTDELHRFAARLGVHRLIYQGPPKTSAPHYDLTAFERCRAIALGAIPCTREQMVAVFRRVRVKNGKVMPPRRTRRLVVMARSG
jgi:Protein of unknown function (DUF4031)